MKGESEREGERGRGVQEESETREREQAKEREKRTLRLVLSPMNEHALKRAKNQLVVHSSPGLFTVTIATCFAL